MINKIKNKYLDSLAMLISFLGSPFIVVFLMLIALAWHYKESIPQFYSYLFITGAFVIIVPVAYMMENIKGLKFIDLHLANKEDRQRVLLVTTLSILFGYFMLSFIGVPKPLLLIEIVGVINLIIISLITFKLKLSIHLAVVTIASTLVVNFLGFEYLWLYILLIPLAWGRYYRQKHTLPEILTGISISLVVTVLVIGIFRFLM